MGEGKSQDWPRAGFGLARLGSSQETFGIPGNPEKVEKSRKKSKKPDFQKVQNRVP